LVLWGLCVTRRSLGSWISGSWKNMHNDIPSSNLAFKLQPSFVIPSQASDVVETSTLRMDYHDLPASSRTHDPCGTSSKRLSTESKSQTCNFLLSKNSSHDAMFPTNTSLITIFFRRALFVPNNYIMCRLLNNAEPPSQIPTPRHPRLSTMKRKMHIY
jgi:hypothetical protein